MMHPEAPNKGWSSASVEALSCSRTASRELVSEIIALWAQGVPADAHAFLAGHPELKADKSLVLDLAYEEYCCRKEAGDPADAEEFCARFPTFRASLRRLIQAHQFLEQSSPVAAEEPEVRWPKPGETLLGFALLRELGRGGFGQVFLATEPALGNRLVAVKIALRGAAEAETLGRLRHPNIVPVHSVQEDPHTGLTAICMPYAGSATLCDVFDRAFAGPGLPTRGRVILDAAQDGLPPENGADHRPPPDHVLRKGTYVDGVVHLGAQLADALAFTHAQGIYHRDLKPSNVLLTPDGKPMLLDFNLSFDEQVAEERLGGTLPYMAPEHLRATDLERGVDPSLVDERSDVFSLGVILYEMLTGVHPFGRIPVKLSLAEVRAHLLQRQQAGPNPLRRFNAAVDRPLARLIERCLAFDPKDRPQSAADLAVALRRSLSLWQQGRRWVACHPWAGLGAAVLVLTLSTAGSWLALREPHHFQSLRAGLEAYDNQEFLEAAEHFTRAVEATPRDPWVWFARGRCFQQQAMVQWVRGEPNKVLFRKALKDYERAHELTRDGRILVCQGVCNSLLPKHHKAIEAYEEAILAGFASAEVFNNLGYCHLQNGNWKQASECLDQAIARNPELAAAYHNRAWVGLLQGHPGAPSNDGQPRPALATIIRDIDQAIDLCPFSPKTAELYADAATCYAQAATEDDRWVQKALSYGQLAIANGQDPMKVTEALCAFSGKSELFQALAATPKSGTPFQTLRVVDPISGIPAELLFGR
jgi:tetratricopeptide (TPR) repeat protein